ncbi:GIY-YIG nuclease family protein [Argonema galeatum]|uniref:GIY-YIG nuclease family protein n=1 Tax=Argonema galeatum TaxID=2942762 RepID=UPI002010FF61|nr:GIY-YIG nuclease family protein [Argonema galeatum]MCL1463474.1 GIY-YIG nuclease family protein [Argonema galeatum A003/A1]
MIADALILALPKVSFQAKQLLPEYSGIYYILDETNNVWYIGQAKNLRKRWQGKAHHRIYQLETQKKKHFTIYYEQVNESQLDSVEKQRIEKYHPHLNSSSVKTKKVRPTETLLRETIAAIADFAFLLGVEPPRKEVESQISNPWLGQKKILGLSVIHICLDLADIKGKFKPESINEESALIKRAFSSRKAYASKWESFPPVYSFMYRLSVNSYVVEVNYWSRWFNQEESEGLREYTQTTLAKESIRVLTPESLAKLQHQADKQKEYALYLNRLNPYISDPIKLLFNEQVDSEGAKKALEKISEGYKAGMRGIGSRSRPIKSKLISSEFTTIEEILIDRGIDLQKYSRGEVIYFGYAGERMGVYMQCFNIDLKKPQPIGYKRSDVNTNDKYKFPTYNLADGILNNNEIKADHFQFNTVYLLASVEKKAWLLVEEYLEGFAKPATKLNNGEGFVEKFYVSARKYIVPAKLNIKLENIGYSAWIPFGVSEEFTTFEAATEEIRKRLKGSGLSELKVGFKRETIEK